MKALFQKKTELCCELMQEFLDEGKVGIYYNPIIRSYHINTRIFQDGKQMIYNCPWCGCKLPNNLLNQYYDTLEREYNILYEPFTKRYYEILDTPNTYKEIDRELPEEFKSDKWWKKRKL